MVSLSARLRAIADLVPPGSRIADIGTDHALLPVYLAQQRAIAGGIAGELNEGPYQAACRQVKLAGLERDIQVRRGDGLRVLRPGEADCVIIAGMGGATICGILDQGRDKLGDVRSLILAPNVAGDAVRRWLFGQGWRLVSEELLEEDGQIYELLYAEHEEASKQEKDPYDLRAFRHWPISMTTELLFEFGPYLLRQDHPVFGEKWRGELEKRKWILNRLEKAKSPESEHKKNKIKEEIRLIEEVLACWRKFKPSCK